jgi:hypothetical protein
VAKLYPSNPIDGNRSEGVVAEALRNDARLLREGSAHERVAIVPFFDWKREIGVRDRSLSADEAYSVLMKRADKQQYETIVVDEAREFEPQELEALEYALADSDVGQIALYGDPEQRRTKLGARRAPRWDVPWRAETIPLMDNLRNSPPIARAIGPLSGIRCAPPFDDEMDGDSHPVRIVASRSWEVADRISAIRRELRWARDEGLRDLSTFIVVDPDGPRARDLGENYLSLHA